MKSWVTATTKRACGGHVTHVIPTGEIYLRIEIGTVRRLRCGLCAESYFGMVAPSDAPPDVDIPVVHRVAQQPELFDAKSAAAGPDPD